MAATQGQSPILYQSADREITLIDIPTSIATAQGRCDAILLSTPPLEHPIHPKEEYRPKANKSSPISSVDTVHHAAYKSLIEQALLDISAHVVGPWCAPRGILTQLPQHGKDVKETEDPEKELKRRFREWAACAEKTVDDASFDFHTMMASLGAPEVQPATAGDLPQQWKANYFPVSGDAAQSREMVTDWTPAFHNADDHPISLSITRNGVEKEHTVQGYHFTIPARSTFFLGDCDHPDTFRSLFRTTTDEHNLPRHFDLVLLDPPWPNRSAKRKGAYEQIGGMPYLKKMLLKMDIDNYLEHNALVGIWITNKPALRDHVLGPGGLFEMWNVGLVEEWVWVKTTTKGEPMFDIDDAMRKPYEVLILGRAAPNAWTTMAHAPNVRRRVIAAVPDVHSRKPCLKEMLEPYMPDPTDYSALEVFARYLVAGWASWGNEVLKYNSDVYWTKGIDEQ
ncbi:hypothetical protein EKO04_006174 [Ascochyta lentis]|uniref:MT-A70-domain-containing protein n=1 Tax=Ascochyta lentis TaxID=205686 RepID=A0A8H7MI96_9PLEO|nr:hypothetical protein EKO04_006174 [Ascochyta lentis]